jgi:hypothetical protein
MEIPMLATVSSVRRRFRQQFFKMRGRYRVIVILIYAREGAEFNPASDERPDFTGERAGSGRRS